MLQTVVLGHTISPSKGSRGAKEASSTFQFWTDLAHRMGFGDEFPWGSLEDILDYRLSRGGRTFAEFESATYMEVPSPNFANTFKKVLPRHRAKLS